LCNTTPVTDTSNTHKVYKPLAKIRFSREAYRLVVVLLLVRPMPAHPPPPVVAPLEHVVRGHRVQGPVAALAAAHVVVHAGPASRDLDETIVQA